MISKMQKRIIKILMEESKCHVTDCLSALQLTDWNYEEALLKLRHWNETIESKINTE